MDNQIERKFRPDIEGMRAIAVLLVIINHAGMGFSGGFVGVDVFFVISGFLITRILYDQVVATGRISFLDFYARRIRRIVPAASFVILVTLIASWVWLSPLQLSSIGWDAITASISGINYRLAIIGTDYFAVGSAVSPLQHYWSLSVEEQFYLIWPALIALVVAIFKRYITIRTLLSVVLVLIIGVSLYMSYVVTDISQPWAYFGLATRAWEIALGGLLALNTSFFQRLPRPIAVAGSWIGLITIVVSAIVYSEATAFPGVAALVPVIGTLLVLGCNVVMRDWSSERLLGIAPLRFIGKISYSLYLWHWPFFVIAPECAGRALTTSEMVGLMILVLYCSIISYYAIERVFHRMKDSSAGYRKTFAFGGAMVLVPCLVGAVAVISMSATTGETVSTNSSTMSIVQKVKDSLVMEVLPNNLVTPLDRISSDSVSRNCIEDAKTDRPTKEKTCRLGDITSNRKIVLLGDSHATQWVTPLADISLRNNLQLITYTKSGCPPYEISIKSPTSEQDYIECYAWRKEAIRQIKELSPQYIIITSLTGRTSEIGLSNLVKDLQTSGAHIVYLLDTPYPASSVPECLIKNQQNITRCSLNRKSALNPELRTRLVESALNSGSSVIDTEPWFCSGNICPAVVDNIIVYYDGSHISSSYAQYLTSALEHSLLESISDK